MFRQLFRAAALLVLPLAVLLWAQWPLRELVQAGSRQANDAAQVLFALLMAFAVTHASRSGSHLVAGTPRWPRIRPLLMAGCLLPWCLFMLWSTTRPVWESMRILERFPETLNPGYFLVKAAAWLMVLLVLLHALAAAVRGESARA
jgi:hypothetical protein